MFTFTASLSQVSYVLLVCIIFLCLHLRLQPFSEQSDDDLQSLALICTTFIAYGALLLKQEVGERWLAIVTSVAFVIPMLGFFIMFFYVLYKGAVVATQPATRCHAPAATPQLCTTSTVECVPVFSHGCGGHYQMCLLVQKATTSGANIRDIK